MYSLSGPPSMGYDPQTTPPVTILIVEDDEDDIELLKSALRDSQVKNPVQVARHGQEALDYLDENGSFSDREDQAISPLVLLDLKLPYVMGLEVLKQIREKEKFRSIIVIPFTSSQHRRDIHAAYRLGANGYLVKPTDYERLCSIVKAIRDYWLTVNQPPMGTFKAF